MSDLHASARLKVSSMSREEIAARRAFLEAKHAAKLCQTTNENKTPIPVTPSSSTKIPVIVSVDNDSDSPVTLGTLLAARLTPASTKNSNVVLPSSTAQTTTTTTATICTTGGRRRLRRVCLSPVNDDDEEDNAAASASAAGGASGNGAEVKITAAGALIASASAEKEPAESIANILPPPLLANCVVDTTEIDDDSTSICLASLKASFSARKNEPPTSSRLDAENEDEDDDNYDYQDGWLVDDDDDDEEEEDNNNNSTEEEEDSDQLSGTSGTSDSDDCHDTDSDDDDIIIIDNDTTNTTTTTISPSPRVPPSPSQLSDVVRRSLAVTSASAPLTSTKKQPLESLLLLRDGAIHPLTGRILIREEVGLGPLLKGASTARHTFRSRATRDALTLALYAEYNCVVFGGRLPPALLDGGKGADEKEGTIIPVEWRGRLVKTAGLTFTRTARQTGARCARVALSVTVLDSPSRLATTLLHELCHAASWCIDGINRPPHGRVFNAWGTRASTAYPKRAVTTCHSYRIVARFQFLCDDAACGAQTGRHSKGGGGGGGGGGTCRACGRGVLRLINAAPLRSTPATTSAYQVFLSRHRAIVSLELGANANPRLVLAELARRWGEEKTRIATMTSKKAETSEPRLVTTTTTAATAIVVDDDDDDDGDIKDVTDVLARKLIL